MEMRIVSHIATDNFMCLNHNEWDVICITNSDSLVSVDIQKHARSYLHLIFDDIDCPLSNYIHPCRKDVESALEFSVGKKKLIVTCHGGISRSAAIGYVVKCKECQIPRVAINILTPLRHYPNRLVVKYGAEILGNKAVYDVYEDWLQKPVMSIA